MGSVYSRLEILGRRLTSLIDEERTEAAKALGREDPQEVIDLVHGIIAASDYAMMRRDAVSAIAYTRSDPAVDALLALALDGGAEVEVRAQAAEGLGHVIQYKSRGHARFDEVADALVGLLDDREPAIRLWAAQAIGVGYIKRGRRRLLELAVEDRTVVEDRCWGTVRDEARAALFALDHRQDLMWPLLQRDDAEAIVAIRRRVLSFVKNRLGPITVPPVMGHADPDDADADAESESEADRQLVEDALIRDDRMPIHDGKGGYFSITPEAVVYYTSDDGGTRRENRPRWLIVAIKAASRDFPELNALLPSRPSNARRCGTCKGRGKVLRPWRRVGPYCDSCWGLGWTCLPAVTKEDLLPPEEPSAPPAEPGEPTQMEHLHH